MKYTRRARSSTARIAASGDSPTTMNSPDVSWRISLPSLAYRYRCWKPSRDEAQMNCGASAGR